MFPIFISPVKFVENEHGISGKLECKEDDARMQGKTMRMSKYILLRRSRPVERGKYTARCLGLDQPSSRLYSN